MSVTEANQGVASEVWMDKPYLGYWEVLRGKHTEGGYRYTVGDIVHSKSDLSKQNQPNAEKFRKLDPEDHRIKRHKDPKPKGVKRVKGSSIEVEMFDAPKKEEPPDTKEGSRISLQTRSKNELLKLASEEGVEVTGSMSKEEIISALLGEEAVA